MFQFTREFIINDAKGRLTNGVKFLFSNDVLYIDNLVNIRKKDVHAIYKTAGAPAKCEVAELSAEATDTVRLVLKLGLDERVSVEVNDYYLDHTKEFLFDGTLTQIKKQIDKVLAMNNREMFTASLDAAGTTLTLTARDPYVRFKDATRYPQYHTEVLEEDTNPSAAAVATGHGLYKDYVNQLVITQKGFVGRGTTRYIIENLRLPTIENLNPFNGNDTDERPIPGAIYDQYTVELLTERRHIGGQVMGAVDTSLTTLIFFVKATAACEEDNPSEKFATELAKLCDITTTEALDTAISEGKNR